MIKTYVEILDRDLDERRALEFEDDTDGGGVFQLLDNEINKTTDTEDKPEQQKWQCVNLTVQEVDGLKLLCERLRGWAHAKLHYPKTFAEDSMELLDRLEVHRSSVICCQPGCFLQRNIQCEHFSHSVCFSCSKNPI